MKVQLLSLVLGASAYVVSEVVHDTAATVQRESCKLAQAVKELSSEATGRYYHDAMILDDSFIAAAADESEDLPEYFDTEGGGQHAFHLFESEHPPHRDGPKKGKKGPHRGHPPHRKNPHDQRDKSIYEVIAESEYFTTLHDIIKGDKHAVEELNKTSANLTLFAPTNKALAKYESHAPPLDYLRKILLYHLLPEVYPAGRVLKSQTLETLYEEESLGQKQRLSVDIGFRGLTLNHYARIIYIDVFTSNGIIHAIDNLLFPPPPIYFLAEILPSTFSTFINAAWKTGLVETLNETSHSTVFAPSNFAFATLGRSLNAYLFSPRGTNTLRKLLKYHVVPNTLFYSDAVYEDVNHGGNDDDVAREEDLVKHYEFETLAEGAKINVDVGEWGRFKSIVFNGRRIRTVDGPAKNGVLQELANGVILPYKKSMTQDVSEMSVEEFESLFDGQAEGSMFYAPQQQQQQQQQQDAQKQNVDDDDDDEEEEDDVAEWIHDLFSLF